VGSSAAGTGGSELTTFRLWAFDTAEDAFDTVAAVRGDPALAGGSVVGILWPRDQVSPRLDTFDPPARAGESEVDRRTRRSRLLDALFLEPLRRATRGETVDSGQSQVGFGLREDDVNRLRDAVVPGRSVVVTWEQDTSEELVDALMARRPLAQWKVVADPYARVA
jgi:hypothetical protein